MLNRKYSILTIFILIILSLSLFIFNSNNSSNSIQNETIHSNHTVWIALNHNKQENIDNFTNYFKNNETKLGINHIIAPTTNQNDEQTLATKHHHIQLVKLNLNKHYQANLFNLLKTELKSNHLHGYLTGNYYNHYLNYLNNFHYQHEFLLVSLIISGLVLIFAFHSILISLLIIFSSLIAISLSQNILLITNLINIKSTLLPVSTFILLISSIIFNIFYYYLTNNHEHNLNKSLREFTVYYLSTSILLSIFFPNFMFVSCELIILFISLYFLNSSFSSLCYSEITSRKIYNYITKKSSYHMTRLSMLLTSFLSIILITCGIIMLNQHKIIYHNNLEPMNYSVQRGNNLIQNHFNKNVIHPININIHTSKSLNSEESLQHLDSLTNKLNHQNNIANVKSLTQPDGKQIHDLYINHQLKLLTAPNISNYKYLNNQLLPIINQRTSLSTHHLHSLITQQLKLLKTKQSNYSQIKTNNKQIQKQLKSLSHRKDLKILYIPYNILKTNEFKHLKSTYISNNNLILKIYLKNNLNAYQKQNVIKKLKDTISHSSYHLVKLSNSQHDSIYYYHHFRNQLIMIGICLIIICLLISFLKHSLLPIITFIFSNICAFSTLGFITFFKDINLPTTFTMIFFMITNLIALINSYFTIPNVSLSRINNFFSTYYQLITNQQHLIKAIYLTIILVSIIMLLNPISFISSLGLGIIAYIILTILFIPNLRNYLILHYYK